MILQLIFKKQLPDSHQICLLNTCAKHLLFFKKTQPILHWLTRAMFENHIALQGAWLGPLAHLLDIGRDCLVRIDLMRSCRRLNLTYQKSLYLCPLNQSTDKRHLVLLFNRHIWGESGSCFINKNCKIISLAVPNVQKLNKSKVKLKKLKLTIDFTLH